MMVEKWIKTNNRFVAFFDILGFKDLVMNNSHQDILSKLEVLSNITTDLSKISQVDKLKASNVEKDQTRSITFSDSIIIFSKSDTFQDALKILIDSYIVLTLAIQNGIPIKGALSYGHITVDFEKSLFFGQPIIDAYLLHEELQMLTVIIDNKFENKIDTFEKHEWIEKILIEYRANLKSGRITHKIIKPFSLNLKLSNDEQISKMYRNTCGRPRIYIDNTIDFLNSLPKE